MKLALAVVEDQVSCHFGSTESFVICEIQGTEVIGKKVIGTEGNQHGALPGYLASLEVNAVIAASMGGGAMRKLADLGIEFYNDVNGHVDKIIQQFINNELVPTKYDPNIHECNHSHGEGHNNEHQHEHHHGESHGCGCGGN